MIVLAISMFVVGVVLSSADWIESRQQLAWS
jgi:hypothetical protein